MGRTPDPDMTLTNLEKVSASLGAKAILWELFNFNPPSLRLYVELCATSQFLSEILINNPGMIDDLVDSLVVDRPVPGAAIKAELAELCKGAEDLAPILWSFRNKEWVRIGTRDILGREPIREVTRELADVAEAIVTQVARDQWNRRVDRFGTPRRPRRGRRDRWAILALGKFGGRELNYHSDLDLVFLHEADGYTAGGPSSISNEQFVTEVVQRLLKALGSGSVDRAALRRRRPAPAARCLGPPGADLGLVPRVLPPVDADLGTHDADAGPRDLRHRRLRPGGDRGRPLAAGRTDGSGRVAAEVVAMRQKLEASRPRHDLKRGPGGLADLEFIVQYLLLVHAPAKPDLLRPNFWDALAALRRHRNRRAPSFTTSCATPTTFCAPSKTACG